MSDDYGVIGSVPLSGDGDFKATHARLDSATGYEVTFDLTAEAKCKAVEWSCPASFWRAVTMHGEVPKVGERYAYECTEVSEKDGMTTVTFQWKRLGDE